MLPGMGAQMKEAMSQVDDRDLDSDLDGPNDVVVGLFDRGH